MPQRPNEQPPIPAALADSAPGASGLAHAAPDAPGLSSALSDAIRVMRLPLLLGPLLVHACLAPESSLPQFILARAVGDISVPAFFFISGFLYFATFDGTARCYARKLRDRIRSLAIPYLLWNLIGYFTLAHLVHMVAKADFLKCFWAVRVARRTVGSAPVDGPLYFIKWLFLLALAAPLFHAVLRHRRFAWLAPAAVLFWLFPPVATLGDRMFVVAGAMSALGVFAAQRGRAILGRLVEPGRVAALAIGAYLAVATATVALHLAGIDGMAIRHLDILAGIPAWFAIAGILSRGPLAPLLRRAQGFAMFLFCSFDLIMAAAREIWRPLRIRSDAMCLKVALMTFCVSLAAYLLLAAVARPLLRLLVGDRR